MTSHGRVGVVSRRGMVKALTPVVTRSARGRRFQAMSRDSIPPNDHTTGNKAPYRYPILECRRSQARGPFSLADLTELDCAAEDKPPYLGHRQRLRDRFLKAGLDGLADYELVELLLTLAIPRSDVKQPAKALMCRFGSLKGILDAPLEELRETPGIGVVAPVALRIIRAAAARYLQQSAEGQDSLANPERLAAFWRMRMGDLPNEVFEVAFLDSAYRLLRDGVEIVAVGTIDRAVVYPRRIIESALRRRAAALVLAHNHPNGDLEPSEHDKLVTRALVLAAETVQLKIVDHLIVSADRVFSFRGAGLL